MVAKAKGNSLNDLITLFEICAEEFSYSEN